MVLFILVVRPVGLDDAVDTVDGAGDAVGCYEVFEVPVREEKMSIYMSARVDERGVDESMVGCFQVEEIGMERKGTYLSRKSTDTPKAFAMLERLTTR